MKDLTDKVVWITGASSGIGEALAYELIRRECNLILSARRTGELEKVKSNCGEAYQDKIRILPLDVADADSLEDKVNDAWDLFGQIDVLFNNAGISQRGLVKDTELEVDRRLFEINYFGPIALTKYLLPKMIERGIGHFVITSSSTGIISTPLRSAYAATKHALHGFYDALRAETVDQNIKVTMVCPGFIKTNITYNALDAKGEKLNIMGDAQKKGIPVDKCAKKMVKALINDKEEVYIHGVKEAFGVYTKRFFPGLYSKLITKIKST
jgi:short-subunit dehydrogenase